MEQVFEAKFRHFQEVNQSEKMVAQEAVVCPENSSENVKYFDVIKSENDPRIYRLIELENKLIEGKIGEVHEYLKEHNNEYTTQDLVKIIKKLKNSDLFHQKIAIPLEEKCFICGSPKYNYETFTIASCKHCFHKECLINELHFLFENYVDLIRCPLCSEVISNSDFQKILPQNF